MHTDIVTSSSNANISIYYGSYANLLSVGLYENEEFDHPAELGNTQQHSLASEIYTYNEEEITICKMTYVDIFIFWHMGRYDLLLTDENFTIDFPKVFLHEMGHALGWHGHTLSTANVMYKYVEQCASNLSQVDVNHIKQLYV